MKFNINTLGTMRIELSSKCKLSFLILLISLLLSEAFQVLTTRKSDGRQVFLQSKFPPNVWFRPAVLVGKPLKMSNANDDDEEDEDDYINDDALGDWRTFRSTLVGNGLSGPGDEDDKNKDISTEEVKKQENPVSPNVELLFSQSDKLGEEYLSGAWAHEAPDIEVGGLVIRLPIEAEIHRNKEKTLMGKELVKRMDIEEEGSSASSYLSLGSDDKPSSPDVSFSLVGAQTLLWYKKAEKLIKDEMLKIASNANENGEIDPRGLGPQSKSLLELYMDYQTAWQEVCLVADREVSKGTATTYVINRPMAFKASKHLARVVLFGSDQVITDKVPVSQTQDLVKFLSAFENDCAVYVGGPNNTEKPAVMIHGYGDLEGAEEIAPGTKVYRGGVSAAMEGVMSGKYSPFDFRFFIGCYKYENGDLDLSVHLNKYQSIACARPIILKQCIQLPKPLWHEVLELCGGELKELSKLELMKRNDINIE